MPLQNFLKFFLGIISLLACTRAEESTEIECGAGKTLFQFQFQSASYPEETSWVVSNQNGYQILDRRDYTLKNNLSNEYFCLEDYVQDEGQCYTFSIYDVAHDGLAYYGGYYKIFYDGVEIHEGADFVHSRTSDMFGVKCPLSNVPSYSPSTSKPTKAFVCEDGQTPFIFEYMSDQFPEETSWNLMDENDALVLKGDFYERKNSMYREPFCLDDAKKCYQFIFMDYYEDGTGPGGYYKIFYGDILIHENEGNFGTNDKSSYFGVECSTNTPSVSSNPSSRPSVEPSFKPSISSNPASSPSSQPTSMPTGSNLPTLFPTQEVNLVGTDDFGRRYFPNRPLSNDDLQSSPDLDWVGNLYFKPPTCAANQYGRNRKCEVHPPLSKNILPFSLQVADENFYFKSAQKIDTLLEDEEVEPFLTTAIVSGDFNNDGLDDIVIGYDSDDNKAKQLLINNGDGTFDSVDLPGSVYTSVNGIALGDFDGNGYLDIVLNSFEVLFNVDGKLFDLRVLPRFDLQVKGRGIAVADINNDGWLDIIMGMRKEGDILFINDQQGSFLEKNTLNLPGGETDSRCIVVADLDGNGLLDIVFANENLDSEIQTNHILLNYGNYEFEVLRFQSSYLRTMALAVGDMNGDGHVDIIESNYGAENRLYLNRGNATFDHKSLPGGTKISTSVSLGDIDGDGLIDIAFGNAYDSNQILRNTGKLSFEDKDLPELSDESTNTFTISLLKANGDDFIDVVAGNRNAPNLIIMNREENNRPDYSNYYSVTELPDEGILSTQAIAVHENFIYFGTETGPNQILEVNYATNELKPLPGLESNTVAIIATNLDSSLTDHVDIIIGNEGGRNQLLQVVNNQYFVKDLPGGNYQETVDIAVGDIDLDGKVDIVIANFAQPNQLLINLGDGIFSVYELPGGRLFTNAIAMHDIDGDSWIDIIIGNDYEPNQILWNQGNGTFLVEELPGPEFKTRDIDIADIDNDGYMDIVMASINDGVLLLLNQGETGLTGRTFVEKKLSSSKRSPHSISITDINSDGFVDLVIGHMSHSNEFLINLGNGTFQSYDLIGTTSKTTAIDVADFNGDGLPEIIIGNKDSSSQFAHHSSCGSGGAKLHRGSWCFHCPSFMGRPTLFGQDQSICQECLPDQMQHREGEACSSDSCPFQQRQLGENECSACRNGTSVNIALVRLDDDSSTWDQPRCVECPAGQYSDGSDGSILSCKECAQGFFQKSSGQSSCEICPSGKYQPYVGRSECLTCEKGGYCGDVTALNGGFQPCPNGTYNPFDGRGNRDDCLPCPSGQYAAQVGRVDCVTCPHSLTSEAESENCPFCGEGFYLINATARGLDIFQRPQDFCQKCPITAVCGNKTTLQTITVPRQMWRDSVNTSQLYSCDFNSLSCIGSVSAATSFTGSGQYCLSGHHGPLCQVCDDSEQYYSSSVGRCYDCPTVKNLSMKLAVFIHFVIAVGIAFAKFWRFLPRSIIHLDNVSIQAKIKILASFYQVVSTLRDVYGIRLDPRPYSWYYAIINIFAFNINDLIVSFLPKSCLGSMNSRLVIGAVWPYIVIFLMSFGAVIIAVMTKNVECKRGYRHLKNVPEKRGNYRHNNESLTLLHHRPSLSRLTISVEKHLRCNQVSSF